MGCRLVTPEHNLETTAPEKAEPMQLTERPSSGEGDPRIACEEPDAEAEAVEGHPTKDVADWPRSVTSSTLSVAPPTVTSQLSDIVDVCEEMKEEDVKNTSEAVLERILRAQHQVEELGDAASPVVVRRVGEIDAQFREFLGDYAAAQDTASMSAARNVLESIESELDVVENQVAPSYSE